jgi:hypothetical protein
MLEQTSHPVARPWGFLLTEAVLIVASILLAFALGALIGFKMHTSGKYQAALNAVDGILAELDASLGD